MIVKRFFLYLLIIFYSIFVASCASSPGEPPATQSEKADMNAALQPESDVEALTSDGLRYIKPIFDKLDVEKDIVYKTAKNENGENEDLLLDVYQPSGDTDTIRPAIIWVHGGGFSGGTKDSGIEKNLAERFAQKGYVTVTINYRLRTNPSKDWYGTFKDSTDDAASALEWLILNKDKYRIDENHIAFGGHSAGACIVTNLCYKDGGKKSWSKDSVFSVIDLSGTMIWMGTPQNGDPPCIIIHGTADTTNLFSDSEKLASDLAKAGVTCDFHPIEGAMHDLTSYTNEVEDVITKSLYKSLIGKDAEIDIRKGVDMTYLDQRANNGYYYQAKQIDINVDGKLDEWGDSEVINLKQLKDAGSSLPRDDQFAGTAMIGWNENDPGSIYLAAKITDDHVERMHTTGSGWWKNSCLEIMLDLTYGSVSCPALQWVFDANGVDLYQMGRGDDVFWKIVKQGDEYVYEVAIKLSALSENMPAAAREFRISPDTVIGISIQYDKCRDGERDYQIGWTLGDTWMTTNFGNVKFISAKADLIQ